MSKELKAMAASWARSFVAAVAALASIGETDPLLLVNAGLAAVIPVIIRYVNSKDPAFGRIASSVLAAAGDAVSKKAAAQSFKRRANVLSQKWTLFPNRQARQWLFQP
jgi:hypothetical protein